MRRVRFVLPKRTALLAGAVLLVLLGGIATRVVLASRSAYLAGVAAERAAAAAHEAPARRERLSLAVVRYRRAARWYAPGNGYVTRALDRLEAIGRAAERAGDRTLALEAFRAIRRAVLGARSFYTPHRQRLARANDHIARLSAAEQGAGKGADAVSQLEAWHRRRLSRPPAPSVLWSALALLGFFAWNGGAVGFLLRAITPEDRLRPGPALRWALVVAGGLLLWLVGLSLA